MHIKVRELLAKAAFYGITRSAIAAQAKLAPTIFTNWKKVTPRLDTLDRATKALDDLITLKELTGEKVES